MPKLIDLTGNRYGKLFVVKRGEDYTCKNTKSVRWLCKCDCGNTALILGNLLRRGVTTSCGCRKREIKPNDYRVGDKHTTLFVGGCEVLVDNEDFDKIRNQSWYLGNNGYVYSNSKKELLHRVITDCPDGLVVDHINHNVLDNRRKNLRICNYSVNGINKKCRSNTGLYYISASHKGYVVYVRGKYIGYFKKIEDAIEARNKAIKETEDVKYNEFLKRELVL